MKLGLVFVFLAVSLAAAQMGDTLVKLDVAGSAHEGHYQARANACMYDHSWHIELLPDPANPESPNNLETLSLNIPNADNLEAFTFVVGFGNYFGIYVGDYSEYGFDPTHGLGSGKVEVARDDKDALLTVTGKTAEGVALTARLECFDILDMTIY